MPVDGLSRVDVSGKTVLVTGGAGFLGKHLCRLLLREGFKVICLDDLSTGSLKSAPDLSSHPYFCFIRHDVTRPIEFVEKIDVIYNMACPASPPRYAEKPEKTFAASVDGTRNMLALAKKHEAILIQASTSEIYGDPEVHPQPESYWGHTNNVGERSCYDIGKCAAETACHMARTIHGVDARIIRIFNTYGPGMDPDDGRVISNFIVQALKGEDITLHGTGSQTRSFCYVDDLIGGLYRAMRLHKSRYDGPINLGNPVEYTILELARHIVDMTASPSRITCKPLPGDDPKRRQPDITKAKKLLGWEPSTILEFGLIRTMVYFRDLLAVKQEHQQASKHTVHVRKRVKVTFKTHQFGNGETFFSRTRGRSEIVGHGGKSDKVVRRPSPRH